jgi:hypothetical protein
MRTTAGHRRCQQANPTFSINNSEEKTMVIPTRAELDGLIRNRLAEDPSFRDALLTDPRAAVSDLVGVNIPEAVTIDAHEETLSHLHIVLPAAAAPGDIADDQLEMVAGGTCWDHCSCPNDMGTTPAP